MNALKNDKTKKRVKSILFTLFAVLFWVGVWWIAALIVGKEWILPTPLAVCRAFFAAFEGFELIKYAALSARGILAGYAAGVLVGFLLAALTARVQLLHRLFSPLLTVVRATPVASFILILWIFLVRSTVPAFSVALIVTPIIWGNCETGFLSRDKKLLEVARVYRFSFFKRLRFLYLPAVKPYFKTAALTALGMGWKAGVAAEVLCTPEGTIGYMIWTSKRDIQTAELFAWTLGVILVCFISELLLKGIFRLFEKRAGKKEAAV